MRKLTSVLMMSALAVSLLSACAKPTAETSAPADANQAAESVADSGSETAASEESASGYELALITDVGTIDDKSFNQGSWEGLDKYATEHNITHKYYKPAEKSDAACLDAIDLAVKGGAKLIVTPGFLFEAPVYEAQTKYPDVKFVTIDAEPKKGDEAQIGSNAHAIFYAEEQAGYLAGYAAVKEGYKSLGFMGGIAVPAVVRFGYGYVQGADAAAKELGLAKGEVKVKYTYVGNFDASPENQTKAASWYNEGVECIFACGGAVGNSVMKAAEAAGKVVIGVDVDQSAESPTVITSATKNLQDSVYNSIAEFYDGKFPGGTKVILTASDLGIGLALDNAKFKNFTKDDYDKLYESLKSGSVVISNDEAIGDNVTDINTEVVEIDSVE